MVAGGPTLAASPLPTHPSGRSRRGPSANLMPPAKGSKQSRHKVLSREDLARALAQAAIIGTGAAAKAFGVDRRTLQRKQKEIAQGTAPELSRMIAAEKEQATQRCRDKLAQAFEVLLDRTIELAPTSEMRDVTCSLEKVGELLLTRKVLSGHAAADREDQEAAEAAGGGSGNTPEFPGHLIQ